MVSVVGAGLLPLAADLSSRDVYHYAGFVLSAILMGLVWIPYGWAADDRVGLYHTIFRSLGCYAAYLFAPAPWRILAICGVVLLAYAYSFLFMRKP